MPRGFPTSGSGTTASAVIADGAITTAKLANDAVTGVKLDGAALRFRPFQGRNGAGACTCTGLKVGDKVVDVLNVAGAPSLATSSFESTITVADQIQQSSASNLSAAFFLLIVVAKS